MSARAPGSSLLRASAALLLRANAAWAEPDYAKEIKPLLKSRCYACHGALSKNQGCVSTPSR